MDSSDYGIVKQLAADIGTVPATLVRTVFFCDDKTNKNFLSFIGLQALRNLAIIDPVEGRGIEQSSTY